MVLQGKGCFTLDLLKCEGGEPSSILEAAQAAGLSHLIVKIADGEKACGLDAGGVDITLPVVQILHKAGIAVWGWHSIQGNHPDAEATIASVRLQTLGLDGYVVEAKDEFCRPGMAGAARQFIAAVRKVLTVPIALTSYRFPNYHPEFPWSTFLEFCDLHMPQVDWEGTHNAGEQLRESVHQCASLPNARPCVPTGPAYSNSGWSPTSDDIHEFLSTAQALGLPAVNFRYWDTCRQTLPLLWSTITHFAWSAPAPNLGELISSPLPSDLFDAQFLSALNSCQAVQVCALYEPDAIQVRDDQFLSGTAAIQNGYSIFFDSLPAGTSLSISQVRLVGDSHLFSWKAGPFSGETTLVLKSGKIILDYTFIIQAESLTSA